MTEGDVKHNIDKLLEELRFAVKSEKEIEYITRILDAIVVVSQTSIEATKFTIDNVFITLLRHESKEIVAKTAKAIAEIAKTDNGREECANADLVTALIDLLKADSIDVLIQTSRALGNICYENENGKKLVEDENGLTSILSVLEKSVALKNEEGAPFLRNVATGFLINFLGDQPSHHKEALKRDAIPVVCSMLEMDDIKGEETAMHVLLILGTLNDASIVFLDKRLTKILVNILTSDASSELSVMCLELLYGQAEDESVKLILAEEGVCELLLKLLEKHSSYCTNDETKSMIKIACDLIVLILTGDESMNYLYNNSNGAAYNKLVQWIESKDRDLQITAVLAMGNFARSDAHCKLMVAQGIHRNLLALLENNNTDTADISFQHALLSVLKNLVISIDNKPIILKDGLLDVLYSMLNVSRFPVIFKLLGTMRIVIDGQCEAAIELGNRADLIKKTVEWCNVKDHLGVQGEANRLLAWVINNSRNKEIALLMIENGAVTHLVNMLTVQHVLMQNEALVSLIILTTTCLVECEKSFLDADIGGKICKFFDKTDSVDAPILQNVLTLLDNMINSDAFREHLEKTKLKALLQNLTQIDATHQTKLQTILDKLN